MICRKLKRSGQISAQYSCHPPPQLLRLLPLRGLGGLGGLDPALSFIEALGILDSFISTGFMVRESPRGALVTGAACFSGQRHLTSPLVSFRTRTPSQTTTTPDRLQLRVQPLITHPRILHRSRVRVDFSWVGCSNALFGRISMHELH